MAQAISNLTKSTNPLAGLMGLSPTPKAPASVFGTSLYSPAAPAPQTNFGKIAGAVGSGINTVLNIPNDLESGAANAVLGTAKGAYNYLSAPAGTSWSAANPQPVVPQPSPLAAGTLNLNNGQQQGQTTSVGTATPQPLALAGSSTPVTSPIPPAGTANGYAAPSTPTTSKGLFPDVASSLAYGAPAQNTALGQNAQNIAADYGQKIADVGGSAARFEAGQSTTGTTPVAEGNAAVTARTAAAQSSALAAGETAALTGNAQALTAQGQTQSALSTAGTLTQPYPTAYGQTSYSPGSGFDTTGGGLPAEVMQQYAQMASSGQYSAIPSFITSNPVLNAQLNVAAKALNPNYTPVGAQAASGVLASLPAMQSATTAAEGIKNTIQTYMQSNPQLNPSDLAASNQLQQWIQGKQLTDPKYQTLFNYLNEYTNTLAPVLGVGGDPTDLKTRIASGFVNAAASGQSISQVLDAMSQLAQHKIADLQSGATGGGTSVPAPAAASGTGGFAETW